MDLSQSPIHLGLGATAVPLSAITGLSWYDEYVEQTADDGFEGRLVSMVTFDESWTVWEMHPNGHEVVLCTEGEIFLLQEENGELLETVLSPGEYVINNPGVWHTADVEGLATAVFITAGVGTLHRARAEGADELDGFDDDDSDE